MVESFCDVWLIDKRAEYAGNHGARYIPAYLPTEIVHAIVRHGGLRNYPYPLPVQTFRNFWEILIDDVWMRMENTKFPSISEN